MMHKKKYGLSQQHYAEQKKLGTEEIMTPPTGNSRTGRTNLQ